MGNRTDDWQGMNWIRQTSRLAIYLRDGLACAYCGTGVEDGAQLSLDHLKPVSKSGEKPNNKPTNLVTCCSRCNSARGNRSVRSFCKAVATYLGNDNAAAIERHVRACSKRVLKKHRADAKALIEQRGSAAKALQEGN